MKLSCCQQLRNTWHSRKFIRCDTNVLAAAALGHLYGVTGKRAEAERIIKELEQLGAAGKDTAYSIALVYAGLSRRDEALRALETGLAPG